MPALKFSYFPISGRGAPVRAAAALANLPIEFHNIPFAEWFGSGISKDQAQFPVADIPVLSVDGHPISECVAIYQYIGSVTGLWPTDAFNSARATQLLLIFEMIFSGTLEGDDDCNLIKSMKLQGEDQAKARKGPVTNRMRFYLSALDQLVGKDGYCVGGKLSIVDLWIGHFLHSITHWDHIDPLIAAPYVHLLKMVDTVRADARVAAAMDAAAKVE